jgi:hypothetical protein
MDFVEKVKEFNAIAGTCEVLDTRKAAMYTGLILEEVAELIESYNARELDDLKNTLESYANDFKKGQMDHLVAGMDRVEALDAAVDIAVVGLGQGIAVGGDIIGACDAVAENNLSKFPEQVTWSWKFPFRHKQRIVLKDENGKIAKPPGFKAVILSPYIRNQL